MKAASLVFVLGTSISLLPAPTFQNGPIAETGWGEPSGGIRIGISPAPPADRTRPKPTFQIAVQNVGSADVVINLGIMLANGKTISPTAMSLVLIDPSGHERELKFVDRRYAAVAGRIDDYTVPLGVGSTYVLRTTLDQYWDATTTQYAGGMAAGRYLVAARFQGQGARTTNGDMAGVSLLNFWTGVLQSKPLEIVVQ